MALKITCLRSSVKYVEALGGTRGVAATTCPTDATTDAGPTCENVTCGKKKKSLWKRLFGERKEPAEGERMFEKKKTPPIECCRVKFYSDKRKDPDLSHLGGQAYRTCGHAYIVQKDKLPTTSSQPTAEEKLLRKIETHPKLKDLMDDPLPEFKDVPQRLLEINDRRLHPLYNKHRSTPPPTNLSRGGNVNVPAYKTVSGPISPDEIPVNIKFNKALLEGKNLYSEYKRVEPPMELIGRLVEMRRNSLPTYENTGRPCKPRELPARMLEGGKKKHVFDTLQQNCQEVEQDRHLLKRKLTTRESEYEARVVEMQNDMTEMAAKLSAKDQTLKQWEREKSNLVAELTSQNSRLTQQLKESTNMENRLQEELSALKERCAMDKSNLQEHVSSVDGLRDELELVNEKKNELERRLHMAAAERDNLATALEEASERILILERHAREQDIRYQQSLKEYSLPQERLSIEDRLNTGGEQRSLLVEMDISEPTLSQECMSVYRQLRSLCQQLKSHNDDDSGLHSDCSTSTDDDKQFSTGLLSEVAQELVGLVLDSDVVRILERLEQARREIQERDLELQRRSDNIMELTTKISVCEVELQAALEERDRARNDASHSSLHQDEAVSKAREVRDQAVTRKNKAEVELAKTRVELMQANSQLLEAIQQKVELSQQLEQWQMDMQELLDEQLKTKLSSQEIKPAVATRRRLLNFFQR